MNAGTKIPITPILMGSLVRAKNHYGNATYGARRPRTPWRGRAATKIDLQKRVPHGPMVFMVKWHHGTGGTRCTLF